MYICTPNAEIAQLVEHDLAKVGVASSSLVFRSKIKKNSWRKTKSFFCPYLYIFALNLKFFCKEFKITPAPGW